MKRAAMDESYRTLVAWARGVRQIYRRVFSVPEIEHEPILQWMFGASLLFSFLTYSIWIQSDQMTIATAEAGRAVCWPYFQDCYRYFFLDALPESYSQTTFYMGLYAAIVAAVWSMWKKRWTLAHVILLGLFLWEMLVNFFFAYQAAAPYNYYHLILTGTLLFAANKEFFLKLAFVLMYFMSVTTKLDSTWVMGTYFTSLKNGLPLFPDWSTALLTNGVMGMQLIGCWFLMSKRLLLQRLAFLYFFAFHLYSGIFVLYLYPTVSVPNLLILFGPMYRHTQIPFGRKTIAGWLILLLVVVFQLLGFYAPGDRRITLEGNKFGMFMFEANHQCIVTLSTVRDIPQVKPPAGTSSVTECTGMFCRTQTSLSYERGTMIRTDRYESASSWNRCYPYVWWSRLHRQCALDPAVRRIGMTIDHSINGGPFYRIVDAENVCDLTYRTFGPNDWIISPPEARSIGVPVENEYSY